ncbi:MAG: hypothetical protein LBR56_03825 [Sporomusaceae bacterium]|nr:hypothetical protein [Sporomusaceae bacterium]
MAENLLKEQFVAVDQRGNVEVLNIFNDDSVVRDNYEEKKTGASGMTEKKTMRHVAQIPSFLFHHEPLLKEYHKNISEYPAYARKCLRTWLLLNPEYKCNDGNI